MTKPGNSGIRSNSMGANNTYTAGFGMNDMKSTGGPSNKKRLR